uniref:Putative secreted peptide n=1 Tax=Anopheles braziliensis TaxID=58242 RepID=A0A2M3ZVS2_9DIPT
MLFWMFYSLWILSLPSPDAQRHFATLFGALLPIHRVFEDCKRLSSLVRWLYLPKYAISASSDQQESRDH